MFFASFIWITLCIISLFLSTAARHEPRFYFAEGNVPGALSLWIASMFVLDIAVFVVGITVGYNPSYFPCIMLLFIQWVYIQSAIIVYTKQKIEGNRFDETKVKHRLRGAPLGIISIGTLMLAVSLGIISFDEILPLSVIFFGTAIFFSGLDFLFLRFLEFRQGG